MLPSLQQEFVATAIGSPLPIGKYRSVNNPQHQRIALEAEKERERGEGGEERKGAGRLS